jgi:hypothetical protein
MSLTHVHGTQIVEVHDLDTIVRQRNNMKSEVLKNVGVWSEYGIADARAALWGKIKIKLQFK